VTVAVVKLSPSAGVVGVHGMAWLVSCGERFVALCLLRTTRVGTATNHALSPMTLIFNIVAVTLDTVARATGLTYNEVNVLAYYLILPLVYVVQADRILKSHWGKIAYVLTWSVLLWTCGDFAVFCDTQFQISVDFLLAFEPLGLNYVDASVLICVILPLALFAALFPFAYPQCWQRIVDVYEGKPRDKRQN